MSGSLASARASVWGRVSHPDGRSVSDYIAKEVRELLFFLFGAGAFVRFGEEGFEKMVDRVAAIEKRLGIYDLAQFTPHR